MCRRFEIGTSACHGSGHRLFLRESVWSLAEWPLFWILFTFPVVTFLAHAWNALDPLGYYKSLMNQYPPTQPVRWVEYAYTASVMLVCIAALSGVYLATCCRICY